MERQRSFLNTLARISRGHEEATTLATFLEERAVDAEVTRSLPPAYPKLSRTQFEEKLEAAGQNFVCLGIAPPTYEEFLSLVDEMSARRDKVPTIALHRDCDAGKDRIGLIPVDEGMLDFVLPGENLAGYTDFLTIRGGETSRQPSIVFADVPCTETWLGIAGMQAAFVARKNMLSGAPETGPADAIAIFVAMLGGPPRGLGRECVLFQVESLRFMARIIDKALGGLFLPTVDSFGITQAEDPWKAIEKCAGFLLSLVEDLSGPPVSDLEGKVRHHLLMHAVLSRVVPQDTLVALYSQDKARAIGAPHLMS